MTINSDGWSNRVCNSRREDLSTIFCLVPVLSICGLGEWGWAKLGDWVDPWGKGVKKANMVQLSNSVKYIFLKNNVVY